MSAKSTMNMPAATSRNGFLRNPKYVQCGGNVLSNIEPRAVNRHLFRTGTLLIGSSGISCAGTFSKSAEEFLETSISSGILRSAINASTFGARDFAHSCATTDGFQPPNGISSSQFVLRMAENESLDVMIIGEPWPGGSS